MTTREIDLKAQDSELLISLFKDIIRLRKFEDKVYQLFLKGELPGTIHQYQGQEAVAVGNLVRLMQLKGGNAELVEVTLADNSPARDKPLSDLHMPRSASVVAIVRDSRVLMPTPDMVLRIGDEVMALITEDAEAAVQQILIG